MIDVDERRSMTLSLHRLQNIDCPYRFFYDETNNVRKLHIRDGTMNVAAAEPFVLGGIVDAEANQSFAADELRRALQLQSNVRDIKLRHLGSGDFLRLLKSGRIRTFLEWIAERGTFIHYQVIDLLYWSSVDIVDSILAQTDEAGLFGFHLHYKGSLFTLLRADLPSTIALLARFRYPDVGDRHRDFLNELLAALEQDESLDHFEHYMLKGLLQLGRKLDRLPFLADETPNLLVDGLGPFVLDRLCLFKNAQHVLDEEPVIEAYLQEHALCERGKPFQNHRFANSAGEPGVQIADVLTGLLGKAFGYIARTPLQDVEADLAVLTAQQRKTLDLLATQLDRSTDHCAAFAHYIIPLADQMRASILFST